MAFTLVFSDLISLLFSFGAAVLIRTSFEGGIDVNRYIQLTPFILIIFILVYAIRGLYNVVGISPVDELRHLFNTTSIVFVLFMATSFVLRTVTMYSRLIIAFTWVFAIVIMQINRWLTRIISRKLGVWGAPTIVIGNGPLASEIETYLLQNVRLGFLPVGMIDGKKPLNQADEVYIKNNRIDTAVIVIPEVNIQNQKYFTGCRKRLFNNIILISSLGWISSLGVKPIDLEGRLGFEINNNLSWTSKRAMKRGMDLVIAIICILLCLPVFFLIAAAIKLDSSGKIIYRQIRIGRHGRQFKIWKFRTMYLNADKILNEILGSDTLLKAEWEATQKLKDDPRITRVGKFLRKWSLDELPQLINVLRGDMSIVGPRPITTDEINHYKNSIEFYKIVRPGISGMWQVSGRNDTTYDFRVKMDEYYIRNWSPWLDIYIILRTIGVVIFRRGAY